MPPTTARTTRRSSRLRAASQQQPKIRPPTFTFGLIADIQYAPVPDGASFNGQPRFYRHALDVARHAARHFQEDQVELMVNLGDIVDGKCQEIDKWGGKAFPEGVDPGTECVDHVVDALSHFENGPVLHAYGNHCLYNLSRQMLKDKLKIPFVEEPCGDLVGYHSYAHKGVRFVVLDSYDLAKMKRCDQTSKKYMEADKILTQNNHNYPKVENSPEGLTGVMKRFVAFNGAIGPVQMEWLDNTLKLAKENNEKVIILSHQPIHPGSTNPVCLMWNYKEVLSLLRKYKDVIMASFAGHAHKGGYERDRSGIHFRVFEAVLETPAPETTYAMVDVHEEHLEIRGFGQCESATYGLDHQPLPANLT